MQSKKQTIFLDGTHLMLDCFGCDKRLLADTSNITAFLDSLPGALGMKKLMKEPYLLRDSAYGSIFSFVPEHLIGGSIF